MENNFGEILASYRKKNNLSQTELAEKLKFYGINIKNAAVSAWEKNVSLPNVRQFFALCRILDITDIYNEFIASDCEGGFSGLNEAGKQKAAEYIQLLLLSDKYRRPSAPVLSIKRKIRFALQPVSAGSGNFLDDENFEELEVGDEVPREADFGVRVSGDSMEPRFYDGDTVWIKQTEFVDSGQIGIFFYEDMTYCKKLLIEKSGIFLVSLNEKYAPISIDPEKPFRVFGKVLS